MKRSIVAIAAIVAFAGCGGGASSPSAGAGASLAPTATVAKTASLDAVTPVPAALKSVWLGPAREIAGLGGPQALTIMRIRGGDAGTVSLDVIVGGQGQEALNSTVTAPAPGQIEFISVTAPGCAAGDKGTYRWTTTADGTGLTMTEVTDVCASRAEALVGEWIRSACKEFGCLGDLEPGRHQTSFFELIADPTAFTGSWRMQYGQVSYTVPTGWANAVDDPGFYNIVTQEEYAKTAPDLTLDAGISLFPDQDVAAQDEACSPNVEPGVRRTSAEIAARIAIIPSLDVGLASPTTTGGRSGTMLDVALKQGWSDFCAVDGGVPVLSSRRIYAGERWRLILLDVADDNTLAIIIGDASSPSRFDDVVTGAMPIVSSFEFEEPAKGSASRMHPVGMLAR
jgi:hypothetical protein